MKSGYIYVGEEGVVPVPIKPSFLVLPGVGVVEVVVVVPVPIESSSAHHILEVLVSKRKLQFWIDFLTEY